MSKYIDAEKLKEKINEVRQDWLGDSTGLEVGESGAELGAAESVLDSIDDIIDSLQQEQSKVDLEKEIHMYFNPHGMELQFDRSKGNTILKPEQLIDFARHFYNLGLNARKEQQNMGDYIFSFKIGKVEFGMRRDFCWWFNNGYTKQFMWWYVYDARR